jgi:pyruvyl transferase EpsI
MEIFLRDTFGDENVITINESDVIHYLHSLKVQIRKSDIIVLSGGGNMGDLYPRYEAIRRLIIKNFPDNKIIIFPQTVDYSEDRYGKSEFARFQKLYGQHENLILCARENRSYQIMKDVCQNVMLVPDIVFYLYGKISLPITSHRNVGVCLRDDKESALTEEQRQSVFKMVEEYSSWEKITTMSAQHSEYRNIEERGQGVVEKLSKFSTFEMIVTDRLHGMIFSTIADVPCVAIDNVNHKISGVYEMVKQSMTKTRLVSVEQMMNGECFTNFEGEESSDFDGIYDDLRKAILL